MIKKLSLATVLLAFACTTVNAQRFTDKLDRGLVAVPTGSTTGSTSNLVTWRRLADEYFGVTYNLYKNGTKVASNLTTTSYTDSKSAPITTTYQVAAVVNGVEQTLCTAVTPWTQYVYKLNDTRTPTGYLDITLAAVTDRDGNDVTSDYSPNDAEMADLDGDGQLEIIIKRLNDADASGDGAETGEYQTDENGNYVYDENGDKIPILAGGVYSQYSKAFVVIDAYKVNWQTGAATLLWRIDCGPNMVSLNSTEIDVIAYDWDEDGKAEVVLRGADDMIIHKKDGTTQTVGIAGFNFRESAKFNHTSGWQYAWSHFGREYLIYMNGETGEPYQIADFPLPRLEESEWANLGVSVDYNDYVALEEAGYGYYFNNKNNAKNSGVLYDAWGDNYGHRSTKFFFGAPVLDGRKASLFLGRGIYTRHKMIAMDLDRSTHQWTERWRWNCNDSSSPWYGNGYHNFVIADVDEDGRDEIVYGSMVIDDTGKGLSTTGYQHGDAQHVGDFDPYRKGLEYFGCLEDGPYYGSNYRNATTSQVYWKHTGTADDGRSMMANLSNTYPGSLGRSAGSSIISSVTDKVFTDDSGISFNRLNFRIYWDGDLCSEILDSPGTAKEACVEKPGTGRLFTSSGCNMNNSSKNNPCFQGDIIGDWREEIVVRCGTNIRVYTTGVGTNYSMPSLWLDHQYRQAMVWQMMAYNQPPHLSYFLGELEDITVAPPMLTMEGRTEIQNGGTISNSGEQVLLCETNNMTVSVSNGATPEVVFVNTPSWVQGTDENGTSGTKVKGDGSVGVSSLPDIVTTTYTHTLTGGAFTGTTRLVKQGDGKLVLPNVTETYTGATDVWAGTLSFDGTLQSSPLWLNRFTTLLSAGGTFGGGITADYAASITVGGESTERSSITTTKLTLNYGARVVLDVFSTTTTADRVNAETLVINTKTGDVWENYGPQYLTPVIEFVQHDGPLANGTYDLGTIGTITGDISDIVIEGLDNVTATKTLQHVDGHLRLVIGDGISTTCSTPDIAENSLATTSEGILLPTVDIVNNTFTYEAEATYPTLTATFKDLNGDVTEADIFTLFKQDYESATDASDWTTKYATLELQTEDATYGNYIKVIQGGGSGPRSAYKRLYNTGSDFYDDSESYTIEFDALSSYTHGDYDDNQLIVYGEGATMPSSNALFSSTNYLFKISGGANYGTTYTVDGTGSSFTLTNATWYHYCININRSTKVVTYAITTATGTKVNSGSYTITDDAVNMYAQGFFVGLGRASSYAYIDNIHIYRTDKGIYTFTEPGTLTVTASHSGCASTTATYDADFVGTTISSVGWASLGCRYPLNLGAATPALTAAYIVSSTSNNNVQLTEVSSVPAATGLLLKGEEGTYRIPVAAAPASLPESNLLTAVTDAAGYTVGASTYALASKSAGVGFYLCQQNLTIPAGKAYLTVTNSSRDFYAFGDDATGIESTVTGTSAQPLFDLQGRRVVRPSKGVYLLPSGRKVIITK